MSGGGSKAIAYIIETADQRQATLMANSTPIIMRSLRGTFPQSFRDLTGDYGAFAVAADPDFHRSIHPHVNLWPTQRPERGLARLRRKGANR